MYAPTAVIAAVAPVRITVLRLRRVVIMSVVRGGGRGLGCAKVSAGNKPGQVTYLAYKIKFLTKF